MSGGESTLLSRCGGFSALRTTFPSSTYRFWARARRSTLAASAPRVTAQRVHGLEDLGVDLGRAAVATAVEVALRGRRVAPGLLPPPVEEAVDGVEAVQEPDGELEEHAAHRPNIVKVRPRLILFKLGLGGFVREGGVLGGRRVGSDGRHIPVGLRHAHVCDDHSQDRCFCRGRHRVAVP